MNATDILSPKHHADISTIAETANTDILTAARVIAITHYYFRGNDPKDIAQWHMVDKAEDVYRVCDRAIQEALEMPSIITHLPKITNSNK